MTAMPHTVIGLYAIFFVYTFTLREEDKGQRVDGSGRRLPARTRA
jgi:hypothetical protein